MENTTSRPFWDYQIGPDGIPDKLHKFYSINDGLLSTLREKYLWFSSAKDFNDPFDCYGELIFYKPTTSAIQNVINTARPDLPRRLRRQQGFELSKKPKAFKDAFVVTRQPLINTQGVCCFTKNRSSNLMWSHYANKHQGLCLSFDCRLLMAKYDVSRVHYKEQFTSYDYFENKAMALLKLFTTKSIEWDYEKEYRAIGDGLGKKPFPKESLLGITFGCQTNLDKIKAVRDVVGNAGYSHLEWQQAKMQTNSFDLAFANIV